MTLSALAGLAALQVSQNCNQQAFELVLYFLQQLLAHQETKDLARRLQQELEMFTLAD